MKNVIAQLQHMTLRQMSDAYILSMFLMVVLLYAFMLITCLYLTRIWILLMILETF